jgi:hypothetical protein
MIGDFAGPAYDPPQDFLRLLSQHERIKRLVLDGEWRTLRQIAAATGEPEASVSAQLRHLRKPSWGGYKVEKRRVSGGLWEYRVEVTNV